MAVVWKWKWKLQSQPLYRATGYCINISDAVARNRFHLDLLLFLYCIFKWKMTMTTNPYNYTRDERRFHVQRDFLFNKGGGM